jgi:hypothetical protein
MRLLANDFARASSIGWFKFAQRAISQSAETNRAVRSEAFCRTDRPFARVVTAFIDKDGKIDKIWRGNGWRSDEVIDVIRAEKE